MRGGWGLFWAGALCLGAGTALVFTGPFSVGFGVAIIGVFALSVGAALIAEPWHDCVDHEVDRWMAEWEDVWSPECPVHGKHLCYVRTKNCPMTRDRIDV